MKLSMNIVYTYASQIWNVGCSFLCSILAARMLGQTGQGDLVLYTSFIAFVTLIISVGLPSGFVHYIAARKLERQVCFPIMMFVIPAGLVLVALFIFLFPHTIFSQTLLPEKLLVKTTWKFLLLIHAGMTLLFGMLSALLQSEQAFKKNALTSVVGSTSLLLLYAAYYLQ
ncbi:MAG TPA: oligosaccharide flippase family protein, partial [Chitinophagaceae bacterium]|nr:oligosaccharide flippase family protein [Chitinophagaceae bacterium]